jgi:osmotically-inducible protein OsmY
LRIAQDVIIAIVYRERVPVMSLDVACDKGVVALHGAVRFPDIMDRCVEIAGTVEGVERIVNYLEVVELAYFAGM